MAAPQDITIEHLSGNWILVINLTLRLEIAFFLIVRLSTEQGLDKRPGPNLPAGMPFPDSLTSSKPIITQRSQQKVPWLVRKAFVFATIYLQVLQYPIKDSKVDQPSTKIDFIQTATGGLAGTKEERVLDWGKRDHTDYFFGSVQGQSHFVHGATAKDGSIRPEFELQTAAANAEIKQFLRGELETDWTNSAGFLVEEQDGYSENETTGLWVHTFERNEKLGWTAEQVSIA